MLLVLPAEAADNLTLWILKAGVFPSNDFETQAMVRVWMLKNAKRFIGHFSDEEVLRDLAYDVKEALRKKSFDSGNGYKQVFYDLSKAL